MKKFKRFCEAQTASRLKEIIQPSTRQKLPRHWKKIFSLRYTGTYRSFFSSTWRIHFLGVWECFFVRHQPEISIPPMGLKLKRFCVCLKYITLLYCLSSSSFLHHFFGITGNAERKKSCSQKFWNIDRKTLVFNFVKKRLQYRCFLLRNF